MTSETEERIHQIAADVLDVPLADIGPDSSPESIANWDSIQHLNLVLAIEEALGVQFDPEEIDKMSSVSAIVAVLSDRETP